MEPVVDPSRRVSVRILVRARAGVPPNPPPAPPSRGDASDPVHYNADLLSSPPFGCCLTPPRQQLIPDRKAGHSPPLTRQGYTRRHRSVSLADASPFEPPKSSSRGLLPASTREGQRVRFGVLRQRFIREIHAVALSALTDRLKSVASSSQAPGTRPGFNRENRLGRAAPRSAAGRSTRSKGRRWVVGTGSAAPAPPETRGSRGRWPMLPSHSKSRPRGGIKPSAATASGGQRGSSPQGWSLSASQLKVQADLFSSKHTLRRIGRVTDLELGAAWDVR